MNIYGFTLLRNGIKYDYPFMESLGSLSLLVSKVYLALGDSEDATNEAVKNIANIVTIPTIWDPVLRDGGVILSQQTNIALDTLRSQVKDELDAWGIYLQCDEVLLESEYPIILEDLKKAQEEGYDAVSFRYFHFWQSHFDIAINKKWYPQEIRAVKLATNIESWGDAQGFRNQKRVYESDATIFHYGHVREGDAYKVKKADILKWYHLDDKLKKYKRREKKFDNQTKCLRYLGPHPLIMHDRITRLEGKNGLWAEKDNKKVHKLCIIGKKDDFSPDILKNIKADIIDFKDRASFGLKDQYDCVVDPKTSILRRIFGRTKVPSQMMSKLAKPWPLDTLLILKLSEKGVWTGQ